MKNILIIPDKNFPTHQAFMEEVYTREHDLFNSFFLMPSRLHGFQAVKWNCALVYTLQAPVKNPILRFFQNYLFDVRYIICMPRLIRKHNINIIQVRNITFPLLLALIYRMFFNIRVVYQKSHPYEYHWVDPVYYKKYKFPTLKLISKKIEIPFLHFLMKKCDAVFSISEAMKNNLVKDYGLCENKIFSFGMGINPDFIYKNIETKKRNNKLIRLLYVGTLSETRNLETLIDSFNTLLQRMNSNEIKLSLIGGTDAEINQLKQYSMYKKVEKNIKFYGYLDRNEVYKLIQQHDIGISYVPDHKRFHDSWPTKLTEYLSFGIPVIATDCVLMHKKLVNETEAGLLAHDDYIDIACKIETLINNLDIFNKKAIKASKIIIQNYSYPLMRKQIFEIYKSL